MNIIKRRYSIEPRDRRYVKSYGCLSFAKNIGKNISSKYSQKLVDNTKKSATDVIKPAQATGDLFGNKITDKIISASKKSSKELLSNEANNEEPKERYISPQEGQKIIDDLRLV